jgi:hypothetical protein
MANLNLKRRRPEGQWLGAAGGGGPGGATDGVDRDSDSEPKHHNP